MEIERRKSETVTKWPEESNEGKILRNGFGLVEEYSKNLSCPQVEWFLVFGQKDFIHSFN